MERARSDEGRVSGVELNSGETGLSPSIRSKKSARCPGLEISSLLHEPKVHDTTIRNRNSSLYYRQLGSGIRVL